MNATGPDSEDPGSTTDLRSTLGFIFIGYG